MTPRHGLIVGAAGRDSHNFDTVFRNNPAYQGNPALLAHTQPEAIFRYCLPARRGQKVTPDVIDGPSRRSGNRLPTACTPNRPCCSCLSQEQQGSEKFTTSLHP
ncbi:MAG: hypothetical protein MUD01_15015 [Chloroflexaceae bacterium]|jgi:hypothetical protein|nr:hypothetical protein [Chloroflexaceae bacterium]